MTLEEQIGLKIRELRNRNSLTQEELADRTELTKGFISQLERGLTAPSVSTLRDIAECLGTSLSDFFREEEDIQVVFPAEDYFEKDGKNGNRIHWLIATAQSKSLEPILVRLRPGTATAEDKPHEGEEFGYVLEGTLTLEYGNKTYTVRKGDSFLYPADRNHRIRCAGNREAVFLWVSTPPSF